jgi:hypothetical protein
MSIQQNFPAISPSLSLNFARSKTLDPRITFTRTSSGTRTNETGLVEVVPANAPRFDHSYDPVSGSVRSLGLLVEESRTNLLLQSEDFSTSWSLANLRAFGSGSAVNDTTAPDGTLTADLLTESLDVSAVNHNIAQAASVTTGVVYTVSVFAKLPVGSTRQLQILVANANFTVTPAAVFNLSNGTIASSGNGTAAVVAFPNGWYRLILTTIPATSSGANGFNLRFHDGSTNAYIGDGTSGIYIWGAQLETGAFPTSYIPTTNSTVTRTADNVSMVGENFSSWYNQSEGSIHSIISLTRQMTTDGSGTWTLDNGNFARGISLYHASAPNVRVATRDATFQQTSGDVSSVDLSKLKSCTNILKSVTSESISCHNGIFTGITTYSLDVNINRLLIGLNNIIGNPSNNYFNGTISQLTYYPRRLTNAQLVTLTR